MLLGSSEAGLAISLGAAIPWLCAHLQSDRAADVILDFLEVRGGSLLTSVLAQSSEAGS